MHDTAAAPDADALRLAADVRRAVGRFVRAIRTGTNTAKSAQAETLALLDTGGAANIATLAQHRNVRHQTMRLVVAQLESSGLVRRDADPADGRSQIFSLSKAGRAELTRGRDARASAIALMIRDLLSGGERETLREAITLLERMSASVEG